MAAPWEKYGQVGQSTPVAPDVFAEERQRALAEEERKRQAALRDAESLILQQQNAARAAANEAARIEIARQVEARAQQEFDRTSGKETKKADDKVVAARRILELLDGAGGLTGQFDENFSGGGITALNEYNPFRAENENFDKKANSMLPFAKKLLRTPGEGAQSDKEAQDYRDQLPRASFRDSTNEQLIADLRQTALSVLENEGIDVTTYDPSRGTFAPGQGFAGAGATQASDPIPREMQSELDSFVARNGSGNLDPVEYAAFRARLDEKYGFGAVTPDKLIEYRNEAGLRNQTLDRGVNPNIPAPNRDLSMTEQVQNNMAASPYGTAFSGAADSLGFGAISAVAPDQMAGLADINPNAMAVGQIAGTLGGTSALGKLGASTLGRVAPRLMGGAGKAQFGRDLATDAAYSGIYSGMTGGDPLTGMAMGAAGSAAGQGVGKGLGTIAGGVRASPAVQALRQRGIPLTVGQVAGSIPKALEDAAMSIPGIGDVIKNRRIESLEAFNRAAFGEAGAPIGANTNRIGQGGLDDLRQQASDAYGTATAGARVPLDPQFSADLDQITAARNMLPPDYASRLDKVLENRVNPATQAGELTGDAYQQAIRGIKGSRKQAGQAAPGFEQEYKGALSQAMDALTGLMRRGGGQDVVTGLGKADEAWRNIKTLEDAARRNAGGTGTEEVFTFTPSQLQRAGLATEKKFPGKRPFAELSDIAQGVLPSQLPDSGTAKRAMIGLLGNAAVGGGIGYTAGGGDTQSALQGALAASLLMAGGSRGAQNAATRAMLDRPKSLEWLGTELERRKGLFGSATLPFLISPY